jgi:hypothetical protein
MPFRTSVRRPTRLPGLPLAHVGTTTFHAAAPRPLPNECHSRPVERSISVIAIVNRFYRVAAFMPFVILRFFASRVALVRTSDRILILNRINHPNSCHHGSSDHCAGRLHHRGEIIGALFPAVRRPGGPEAGTIDPRLQVPLRTDCGAYLGEVPLAIDLPGQRGVVNLLCRRNR